MLMENQLSLSFYDKAPGFEQVGPACSNGGVFRPIHYLGSKLRFVEDISNVINRIDPARRPVCDLFAGSGTIANAFARDRQVIAADIQEYSRIICSALLLPVDVVDTAARDLLDTAMTKENGKTLHWAVQPLITYEGNCLDRAAAGDLGPLCDFLENASLVSFTTKQDCIRETGLIKALAASAERLEKIRIADVADSMVTRYFGGIYFSYSQAATVDVILSQIQKTDSPKKDLFLAAILSTVSEIVNTIGKQFAQPIRPRKADGSPKGGLLKLVNRDRQKDVWDLFYIWFNRYLAYRQTHTGNRVQRADYKDVLRQLPSGIGAVYADPPYTRDHYSRYYHVLETICLRDCPEISTVRVGKVESISRGLYRADRHQSPFCIKSQAPLAFKELFEGTSTRQLPLVISYSPYVKSSGSRPRLMEIDSLVDLANMYYTSVVVEAVGTAAHSKLNKSDLNKEVTSASELVLICR